MDIQQLLWIWLKSFGFTLAIEVPLFVLLTRSIVLTWFVKDRSATVLSDLRPSGRGVEGRKLPWWRAALAGAAGTCMTHPLLWFAWPLVIPHNYVLYVTTGELLVALIETMTFWALARPISLRWALLCSFVANAASWGLGKLF